MAGIRTQFSRERAAPCQHQAGHVTQVVAGIGKQGQGVDLPTVKRFNDHEDGVQRDADSERPIEVVGRVVVAVFRTH